ncbi:NAD(P)-dependent oxidoreductase [Schleiferiaceae bacterium]|nr:NAD(P)-dependent oxidoreductase [Schleiferiaceae bacterium]
MVDRLIVAITGSDGFIGNRIFQRLGQPRLEVVGYGRRNSYPDFIERLKKDEFDVVIHCAGKMFGTDRELNESNVVLVKDIIKAIPQNSKIHFIQLSTGAVYGNTIGISSIESDETIPLGTYGKTKLLAEKEVSNLNCYTILRLPSVYGLGNSKGLVYNIINSIRNDVIFKLENGGLARRSFLNVDDLIDVLIMIISKKLCGIYNVSDSSNYTIAYLTELFELSITEVQSENNLNSMVLDNQKIVRHFGKEFKSVIDFIRES